jgi:hypothetical protein
MKITPSELTSGVSTSTKPVMILKSRLCSMVEECNRDTAIDYSKTMSCLHECDAVWSDRNLPTVPEELAASSCETDALKMEATGSSQTLATFHRTTEEQESPSIQQCL